MLKSLKKVAVNEAKKHEGEGLITILKTKTGQHFIIRIDSEKHRSGILIDRLKGPFNTWCGPAVKL